MHKSKIPEDIKQILPESYYAILQIDEKGFPRKLKVIDAIDKSTVDVPVKHFRINKLWIPATTEKGPTTLTMALHCGSIEKLLNEEMETWQPAFLNGRPVATELTLDINFILR